MSEKTPSDLLPLKRKSLPTLPGIYKFLNEKRNIIYIGKAKNLKKRVNSYFTKNHYDLKTKLLVGEIKDMEYIVTQSELEALLLESRLIKKHKPKYNILLKDGKTYPYICIKKERFPRVFPTRKKLKDGSLYFGPYPNVQAMYSILKFIRENFFLRTCSLNLSSQNIASKKFRPCLEYHIKKCKAPCIGEHSEEDYNRQIEIIRQILEGDLDVVIKYLQEQIGKSVRKMQFEDAHAYKMRIREIQMYKDKISVALPRPLDMEVLTLVKENKLVGINYMKIRKGLLVGSRNFFYNDKYETAPEEILGTVLQKLREEENLVPVIHTNIENYEHLSEWFPDCEFIGEQDENKEIMALSQKNAEIFLSEKKKIREYKDTSEYYKNLLERLQKELELSRLPERIECFDNSHIQGHLPVSSCVVFIQGKPDKKQYRVYKHEELSGKPDDFLYMYSVIKRRYEKFKEQRRRMPDLIIVDGGKGQIGAAAKALEELKLLAQTELIGIAKRFEEIYKYGDSRPIYIGKTSEALIFLQKIRNEAHNTAVNFHRKRREKNTLQNSLEKIKGIGKSTVEKLFRELKSVENIKKASPEKLANLIGRYKASLLLEHFKETSKKEEELRKKLQQEN